MRLLYFSPRDCWPLTSGARLRDFYLARELVRSGAQLTYLGFTREAGGPEVSRAGLAPLCDAEVILVRRDTSYSMPAVVKGFVGPTPISVLNYASKAMFTELRRLLEAESFDAVQLEGVHLFSYVDVIRKVSPKAKIICDWHNIESELMFRYSEQSSSLPRRMYATRTFRLLHQLEGELLQQCEAHTVCSDREKQLLLKRRPEARIGVVGNGVDTEYYSDAAIEGCRRPGEDRSRRAVVFVGSMDYHANIDGARYFAQEVWPRIRAHRPELQFVIVGSRPTEEIRALGMGDHGITVTGSVEDIRPYYGAAHVVVVPLRVGSGTRLKVLEAMAAGVPVVSTTLGAEGLDIRPGHDAIIGDTADEIADAVVNLETHSEIWKDLAKQGRRLVTERYDWSIVGAGLKQIYREQLERGV